MTSIRLKERKIFIKNIFSSNSPFILFSAFYLIVAILIFLPYWMNGKSLICNADAAVQHYPALSYYGSYLRQCIGNLFSGHNPVFPTWNMSIGLGGDIITTLHYYCLGDPLTLLSVFFSPKQTELCYTILIILRLYVAGIASIFYFKHHNARCWSSVIAALVYCFSGYAISPGVFHPFFVIPMMYLPLLLLGADLIFEGKSPICFILTVAISLLSNFYFFYMLVLFTVIYAVIKYFYVYKKFDFRLILKSFSSFLGYSLIGMMLAMPVFLPNIISLLSSDRISLDRYIPTFYPKSYYKSLSAALVSDYGEYYIYISVSAVALLAVFVLFSQALKTRENKFTALVVIVSGAFLFFPKIASIFNGFSYVTNRWVWALIFVFAYVTSKYLPKAALLTKSQLIIFGLLVFGYSVLCLLPSDAKSEQTVAAIIVLCILSVLVVIKNSVKLPDKVFSVSIACICILSLVFNGCYHATTKRFNWVERHHKADTIYSRYFDSSVADIKKLPKSDIMRFDTNSYDIDLNAALVNRVYGTSFYFSMVNPGTANFQHSQMLNNPIDHSYKNLNNRSYLLAALGVGYYISAEGDNTPRPYGFDIPLGNNCYESNNKLPVIYSFDSVITDSKSLSVTQRQQALLQGAMVEDGKGLPKTKLEFSDVILPYKTVLSDGVTEIKNKGFKIDWAGVGITLEFENVSDCELYVCLEKLDFEPSIKDITQTELKFYDGKYQQSNQYYTPQNNYTSGRSDFLVNMGYSSDSRNTITIIFTQPGIYKFSDMRIVAQPLDNFEKQVERLADSGIFDIKIDMSEISFKSANKDKSIACVAVPYQKGWSAKVDGKSADVFEIQSGLCGIYLNAGKHEIVMTYETPTLKLGWLIFIFGLVILIVLWRKNRLKYSTDIKDV